MIENSEYENKQDKIQSESLLWTLGAFLGVVFIIIYVVVFADSLAWLPWWAISFLVIIIPISAGQGLVSWNRKLAKRRGTEF